MTETSEMDILFFTRGHGWGHALADLAIAREIRRINPDVQITFVSYAEGVEALRAAGEHLVDLEVIETEGFVEMLVRAAAVMQKTSSRLVVSHGELAVLPSARLVGLPVVFLTHWFGSPHDPYAHALQYTDEVLFLQKEGLFPEPAFVRGKVRYFGPVFRNFRHGPSDRDRARRELNIPSQDTVILMVAGSTSEAAEPICDLVLDAFERLDRPNKRLILAVGDDAPEITTGLHGRPGVTVVGVDWQLERWMATADAAITKATYHTTRELNALGIPSVSLSHGRNYISDLFSKSLASNRFLWAGEADASTLAGHLNESIARGRSPLDATALNGAGAASVASRLSAKLASRLPSGRERG